MKNLERKELLKCVFKEGKILNKQKNVEEIALYAKSQISKLDENFLILTTKKNIKSNFQKI